MKINSIKFPFPHLIIDETYTEEELNLIWHEIIFLHKKLLSPKNTGAATENIKEDLHFSYLHVQNIETKKTLKNAGGIFLEQIYSQIGFSDILNITRKLFNNDIKAACKQTDLILEQFNYTNYDTTLLNSYSNGNYYLPHRDSCVISIINVFHKNPKKYCGGELQFPDYNYKINLLNNQTLFFPSCVKHGVSEIELDDNDNPINGRFSVTKFVGYSNT